MESGEEDAAHGWAQVVSAMAWPHAATPFPVADPKDWSCRAPRQDPEHPEPLCRGARSAATPAVTPMA